jgi:16S rRNA (adenine1518-N6/adenine1519-N6)-dimethyltransferase
MQQRPPPAGRHEAKKSLGQNFLIDPNLQRKIVDALEPTADDDVLEIGPGQGALTKHLVGRVGRLTLVELDDSLAAQLATQYATNPEVHVVHRDILDVDLHSVSDDPGRLKVIGNIPYNITTPILFHLIERRPRPRVVVLMVQREVADRILAAPGTRTFGALAVGVQAVADVQRVVHAGRKAFRPVPDVDSTVIRITPHDPPRLEPGAEPALRALTRAAFGQRRKQFQRILRVALAIDAAQIAGIEDETGFDLRARPETFSPDDFILLSRILQRKGYLPPPLIDAGP